MDENSNAAPPAPAGDPPQPKSDAGEPKKLTADELVKKHLAEVAKLKPEDHPESHRLVTEHAEEAGLKSWQVRTLLARFHAHGLHLHARIHPDVFAAALAEALHGGV
jgi:hypothetical protein